MAWVGVAILSAALLPAALAVWVEALTTSPIVRSLLLVALPASAWWLIHTDFPIYGSRWWRYGGPVSSGLLHEAYDSWCGVLASRFVIIGVLVLVLPVLYGLLRPWARWLLLALPVLAVGGYLLRWALPDALYQPLRPLGNYVRTTRLRHPAAYALAHLSPTMNIRLLLLSYPSNITLVPPDWRRVGIGGKALETAAERAEEYDAGGTEVSEPELLAGETAPLAPAAPLAALRQWWIAPSLPLWFGAALYPVLLSIWAVAGLLLGQSLRGRRAEGDVG
jgi:hypothetical protein